ncbi:MAG: hypothetical protein M1826_006624 [Phylliscum demangeonii]|nr:MAG: hypothetical protein M1826_006624 [Phylliscum demangeonii]
MLSPPRIRLASSQSMDSRISGVDGRDEYLEPPSPIEAIPELHMLIAPTAAPTAVKVDVTCHRPGEDMSAVEDGPLFRATMKALEQKTGSMRMRMKKVLKKAEAAQQAQVDCNEAVTAFMEALKEAALSNANAIQPALEHYFEKIAQEILRYEKQNTANLQKMLIEPLTRLYNLDIKQAEAKKRDFEDESREYYAYLGRYLGQRQDSLKDKKRAESDSKYQSKRKIFELSRFDYSSFMQDLHGGRKDQEVLSYLTKFADAQASAYLTTAKKVEELIPQLDALNHEVKEAEKEFQYQRTEREEKRRTLEMSTNTYVEPESVSSSLGTSVGSSGANGYMPESDLGRSNSSGGSTVRPTTSNQPSIVPSNGSTLSSGSTPGINERSMSAGNQLGSSPGFNKMFGDARDNPDTLGVDKPSMQVRKEGLLWALSRPGSLADPKGLNKQAWHKFWIVLDQGRLSEYSNWKQKLDLHMDPIDLRMASVREARNAERRFCFEIITPQFKRVYQATSEDDMNNWISAINNALQSAVEGRGIQPSFPPPSPVDNYLRRDISSVFTGKSSSHHGYYGGHHHSKISSPSVGSVYRRITVGARPSYIRTESNSFEENPDKLLQIVRNTDQGNCWCADCGSGIKTEWVSINLGIVLCIECSGIHRSLGTHISKVRSLTLDTTSFTTDIVELLLQVGNRVSNMIWEARLDRTQKPTSNSTREQRLQFITAKYVKKEFVTPITSMLSHYSTPEETLLASIKKNDLQGVLYAIALGANTNATDRSRNTHAVHLALAAADPATPASSSTASPMISTSLPPKPIEPSKASSSAVKAVPFPIAELLVQNGAEVPSTPPAFPLGRSAQLFLEQRAGRNRDLAAAMAIRARAGGATVGANDGDTLGALPVIGGRPDSSGVGQQGPGLTHSISAHEKSREKEATRLQKRLSAGGRLARSVGP